MITFDHDTSKAQAAVDAARRRNLPVPQAIDAIASARTAALLDPEGEGLQRCLDALDHQSMRAAAE